MGAKWKELDEEEKKVCLFSHNLYHSINHPFQPYIDQAARDKERAEKEKTDYDVRL